MIPMGAIYFILKCFGGESNFGFSSTEMSGDWNCDQRGINSRRRHRWRLWGILKDISIRSGTRDLMRIIM